nr:hypothetical protein [Tanacetum cinerariifolium]
MVQAQANGQILHEEELAFLANPRITEVQAIQTVITHNAAYQADDLDAYDSDYDALNNAKVALMENLSHYGLDVLTKMVNTRTDAELAAAVQNALQTLLPQIRADIREEFRTAPVDAENWISYMEKIFDVMGCEDAFKTRLAVYKFEGDALAWWKAYKQAKGGDVLLITVTWAKFKELFFLQFFPRAEQERLKREYHSIRQTDTETGTKFMQRFFQLAGFLGAAAGTAEEQAKNFQWVLRKSTLNHLMCIPFTDVAQVANAARNYEILHERDDDGAE